MDFITLENKDRIKLIEDVVIRPLKINKDESGTLVETLRADWEDIYGFGREFKMQYYSITPPGLARDEFVWHFHPTMQEDRFLVVQGSIVLAVADNRKGSPTEGLLNLFRVDADKNPYMVLVPKETLHTFMVISSQPAILLNFPTALYNPKEEGRIPFSEANVKVNDGSLFSWENVRKKISGTSSL
ncbi:MAG: dTDP-4-dehydrorhamnose 3,5-epimerase family protein [Candidatus Levybacteria bacterium]|nr:dTDP-4-dehydrorhamnose 3,5-epimerase family protein [Candidatus Levybacteria bacterium]